MRRKIELNKISHLRWLRSCGDTDAGRGAHVGRPSRSTDRSRRRSEKGKVVQDDKWNGKRSTVQGEGGRMMVGCVCAYHCWNREATGPSRRTVGNKVRLIITELSTSFSKSGIQFGNKIKLVIVFENKQTKKGSAFVLLFEVGKGRQVRGRSPPNRGDKEGRTEEWQQRGSEGHTWWVPMEKEYLPRHLHD